jgi:DNA-binding transcriptional LysR family regulator
MLDVRRLRILVAVADYGSFTAAALHLHLTQSAVSQQMAVLEREAHVGLVDRQPRGVQLTPAGELLVERTRALLGMLANIEGELQELRAGPAPVRLGTFPTAGANLIPLALRRFRQRCPEGEVIVSPVRSSEPIGQMLRDGELHIGLVWDYDIVPRPAESGLDETHLLDDPLHVIVPAEHPLATASQLALQDLADEAWIVRDHRPPNHQVFETMCRIAGFEPHVVFRTDDYQSAQGLVAAGIGICLMPTLAFSGLRPDIAVLPLGQPALHRRIMAISLREGLRSVTDQALLGVLVETAGELVADREAPPPRS